MGLCQRAGSLIKLVDELLIEDLLFKGRFPEFNWAQFSLKIELMIFEDVLSGFSKFIISQITIVIIHVNVSLLFHVAIRLVYRVQHREIFLARGLLVIQNEVKLLLLVVV